MDGHRKIGRPKLRWSDVIRRPEGETSKDRRNTRPQNVEVENWTRRPHIGKRAKEKMIRDFENFSFVRG